MNILLESLHKILLQESFADKARKRAKAYIRQQVENDPRVKGMIINAAEQMGNQINQEGNIIRKNRFGETYVSTPSDFLFNNIITELGLGHTKNSYVNNGLYDYGFVRIYYEDIFLNNNPEELRNMQMIVAFLRNNPHELNSKIEQFSNKWSITDLDNALLEAAQTQSANRDLLFRRECAKYGTKLHNYDVEAVHDTEEASMYANYTTWCITTNQSNYDGYAGKYGLFYILTRDDFESVPKVKRKNSPYDDYGLSMIAVNVVPEESGPHIQNVTLRWNHESKPFGKSPSGEQHTDDYALDPLEISKIIGCDVFSVCPGYSSEELRNLGYISLSEIQERLDNGEDPHKIFGHVVNFGNLDVVEVSNGDKSNLIRLKDNKMLPIWCDSITPVSNSLCICWTGDGYNIASADNLEFLLDEWYSAIMYSYDDSQMFKIIKKNKKVNYYKPNVGMIFKNDYDYLCLLDSSKGLFTIKDNKKGYNIINHNEKPLFDDWSTKAPSTVKGINDCYTFYKDDKCNLRRIDGSYISDVWFNSIQQFNPTPANGFVKAIIYTNVIRNRITGKKVNILSQDGTMLLGDFWVDDIDFKPYDAHVPFFELIMNSKKNERKKAICYTNGKIPSFGNDIWFDIVTTMNHQIEVRSEKHGGCNMLDDNGNFISNNWFVFIDGMDNGMYMVKIGDKNWNYLKPDGTILRPDISFEEVYEFNDKGQARVRMPGYGFSAHTIDTEGRIYDGYGRLDPQYN